MDLNTYVDWARRKPSRLRIAATLAFGAGLFLVGLPAGIVAASGPLDAALGLPRFASGLATALPGLVLVVVGGAFAFWSVLAEVSVGRGTPVPMIPTQRLVVAAPFTYCRNPMVLGTATAYLGLGVWLGSASAIGLVLAFATLLLLYAKLVEERELEVRFGADYVEYRRRTPFLLPRPPRPTRLVPPR